LGLRWYRWGMCHRALEYCEEVPQALRPRQLQFQLAFLGRLVLLLGSALRLNISEG